MSKHDEHPKEYYSQYGGVHVIGDGDCLCARFDDFENLQESDAGFGSTDAEAIAALAISVRELLEQHRAAKAAADGKETP